MPSLLPAHSCFAVLDLSNNQLSSSISPAFVLPESLVGLDLSSNFLRGTIDPAWLLPNSTQLLYLFNNSLRCVAGAAFDARAWVVVNPGSCAWRSHTHLLLKARPAALECMRLQPTRLRCPLPRAPLLPHLAC